LLFALVLLALAALMLAGTIGEAMKVKREPVPIQIEPSRQDQPLQRRRAECVDPGHVEMLWGCA
jgi:hypothetical protein